MMDINNSIQIFKYNFNCIPVITLVVYIKVYNGWRIKTKLSDKRYDVIYPIVNVLYNSCNIAAGPVYGDYSFPLMIYSGVCVE